MPTNQVDGHSFDVNDEGFFTDPQQWSRELATILAEFVGLPELTQRHWAAIEFMRADYAERQTTPTLRRMQAAGGFPVQELYALFPGKPAKKLAYLAGLPKPVGCV